MILHVPLAAALLGLMLLDPAAAEPAVPAAPAPPNRPPLPAATKTAQKRIIGLVAPRPSTRATQGQTSRIAAGIRTGALSPQEDVKLDVDLEGLTVRDALAKVLEQAGKLEGVVDDGVLRDARITLKAKGLRLSAVLDVLAEAAGGGWRRETREGKTLIRLGQRGNLMSLNAFPEGILYSQLGDLYTRQAGQTLAGAFPSILYRSIQDEERSTFHCPHCKGQATVIRKKQQPQCTRCSRVFQSDWQFCPADGTRRPAAPMEWKHCPLCGKGVQREQ